MLAFFTGGLNPAVNEGLNIWVSVGIRRNQDSEVLRVLWEPQTYHMLVHSSADKRVSISVMRRIILTTSTGIVSCLASEQAWGV